MKKIGIVTGNRVFAQSLMKAAEMQPERRLAFYPLLNLNQAVLDVEVLNIDVALIDVMSESTEDKSVVITFCMALRLAAPDCRILLLVSQADKAGRRTVTQAMREHQADDFVFYDTSLDYLLAKLAAI